MLVIQLEHVFKSYGTRPVLRGLDLAVSQGEIFGLLGTNGAGKSTLLQLLNGWLRPERGQIRLFGSTNLAESKGRIGYLPERVRYPLRFTAHEYLRFLGEIDSMPRPRLLRQISELLELVELGTVANHPLSSFSRGMLQRIGIAQALLNQPDILLIDEPTTGLDPEGQASVLALLERLRDQGKTIVLTTHYFNEVEQVCDRVGILYRGQLAVDAPVAALRRVGRAVRLNTTSLPESVLEQLRRLVPAVSVVRNSIILEPNTPALQAQVLRLLLDAQVVVLSLTAQHSALAELFSRVNHGEPFEELLAPMPQARGATTMPLSNALFAPPDHPDAKALRQRETEG